MKKIYNRNLLNSDWIPIRKKSWHLLLALLFGMFFSISTFAQTVTVGTGTDVQVYPLGNYYGFERSASIYTAAEIGTTGNILKVGWTANVAAATVRPIKIYLKSVASTTITSSTWASQIAGATLVYDSSRAITVGLNEFTLTTPFGYLSDNLLVLVEANLGGGGESPVAGASVRYSVATGKHMYVRADNAPPTGTGTVTSNRPNIRMEFQPAAACSGTPAPGNTIASTALSCPTSSFSLSLQNPTVGSGVSYQWESSPNNVTYADIAAGTSSSVSVTASTEAWYRCKVTCGASTTTSTPVKVGISPFFDCYNTNSATSASDEEISNVTVGSLNNSSTCATVAPGAGSLLNRYSNYRGSVTAPDLARTSSVNFSLTQTTCGGSYGNGFQIYIDYNQNGNFEDSERVYTQLVAATGSHTKTGFFTVPSDAILGTTGMRVVNIETSFPTTTYYANTSYSWGETEDYLVNITAAPSCIAPSDLTVNNLTYTSANLAWTSTGTNFNIEWGAQGFTQGTGTMVNSATTSYALSGLTAETYYSYYVRNVCGGGNSAWTGPYVFYTGYCVPTGTSNSYRINGVSTSDGFTNISNLANGTTAPYNNYSAMSVSQAPGGTIGYTVQVPVSTGIKIWIDLNKDLVFDASELIVSHITAAPTGGVWTGSITLPEGIALGDYRMRIRSNYYTYDIQACGLGLYGYGEVEDYTLSVVAPPSCLPPSAPTASNIQFNTANLSWTSNGSSFDVEYGEQGFTQGSGTVEAGVGNPYLLGGLSNSTAYSYYVRQDCGAGDLSLWAGPYTFTTPTPGQIGGGIETSSNLPIYSNYGYNYSQQIYLASELTAVLDPGSTFITKIRFKQVAVGTTANYKNWTVYLGNSSKTVFANATDWEPISNLTEAFTGDLNFAANSWVEITLSTPFNWDGTSNIIVAVDENSTGFSSSSFASFASGSNRGIAYYSDGTNPNPATPPAANFGPSAMIAQMQIVSSTPPSCLPTAALTASNIGLDSATISWTGTAPSYQYFVKTVNEEPLPGDTATGTTADTSLELTLEDGTNYYFWIRSVCSPSEFSDFRSVSFKTLMPGVSCAAPIFVNSFPFTTSSTTCGMGNNYGTQCTGNYGAGEDIVYQLNIATPGTYEINLTATNGGTYIGWFLKSGTDCATGSSCLKNKVSGTGAVANDLYNFATAGTYYLIIDSWPTPNCNSFDLNITRCPEGIWTGATSTAWSTASNWSDNTVPATCTNVTVNVANPMVISSDVAVTSLTLGATAVVTVNGSLEVGNISVATGGQLTIANDAALLQTATAVNTGLVSVVRNSNPLFRQDYTLWSSPVGGQNLRAFSPQTLFNRFSSYNTAEGTNGDYLQEIVTTEDMNTKMFGLAKGYLIRMPNNWVINGEGAAAPYVGMFKGTLNNGTLNFALSGANTRLNLVGNPYASPISISQFWTANSSKILSGAYFWRKTNGVAGSGYIAYNLMGGNSPGLQMDNIKAGQGFFVVASSATPGNLVFNNTMRTKVGSSTFYKSANDTFEAHRLWLSLSDATGVVGEALIGYASGATQDVDNGFDTKYFNDSPLALTSLINNNEYSIQGRSLPFVNTDVVPLGFKSDVVGNFTISLASFDGVFADNQDIFLRDNATNTFQNLKLADYTFTTQAGVFNDRFEVQYNSTLSTENPSMAVNNILIGVKDQQIKINAGSIEMQKIELIDVTGRVIYTLSGVAATTATIDTVPVANQMLIVRISTTANGVVNQKIIF